VTLPLAVKEENKLPPKQFIDEKFSAPQLSS
jgi:hypothetical protein